MTAIQVAIAKHEQLRRRVSGLDWTRDPELSVAINLDLSRPERLSALAAEIPQLMMDLAQKQVADKDFTFIAWRPHKRTKPVLIPVPANNVEDTMEAILKDMEASEIESPEDEIESSEEYEVEEGSREKAWRIKGLVSGKRS